MTLNPMQQVMLTVLLGPEDPTAWKRLRAAQRDRAWHKNNPKKRAELKRDWREKNPKKDLETGKRYRKNRRKTDPTFKLLTNVRTQVSRAIKANAKEAGTLDLTGCTLPELRAHLEALFVPGMTWENYGPVWHVDHKRPCASFDLSDPAQQRECFHFTNLQPLFAEDNLRKGDTWP